MGYEFLDHTADLGIRVWADDVKGLFEEAARALFDIITDLSQTTVCLYSADLKIRRSTTGQLLQQP